MQMSSAKTAVIVGCLVKRVAHVDLLCSCCVGGVVVSL